MTRKEDEWTLTYTTPVKTTQFVFRLDTPFEQIGSTEKMEEVRLPSLSCNCVFQSLVTMVGEDRLEMVTQTDRGELRRAIWFTGAAIEEVRNTLLLE